MALELSSEVGKELGRLLEIAAEHVELRHVLRTLAEAILKATGEEPSLTEPTKLGMAEQTNSTILMATVGSMSVPLPRRDSSAAEELGPMPATEAPISRPPPPLLLPDVTDSELPIIASRCRMKADGSRWAAARWRAMAGGADFETEVKPLDREIVEKAKTLPDCFLWMCNPGGPMPSDLSLLDDMGGCFEAAGKAAYLLRILKRLPTQGARSKRASLRWSSSSR